MEPTLQAVQHLKQRISPKSVNWYLFAYRTHSSWVIRCEHKGITANPRARHHNARLQLGPCGVVTRVAIPRVAIQRTFCRPPLSGFTPTNRQRRKGAVLVDAGDPASRSHLFDYIPPIG